MAKQYVCIFCGKSLSQEWLNSPIRIVPREEDLCPKARIAWAQHSPKEVKA